MPTGGPFVPIPVVVTPLPNFRCPACGGEIVLIAEGPYVFCWEMYLGRGLMSPYLQCMWSGRPEQAEPAFPLPSFVPPSGAWT